MEASRQVESLKSSRLAAGLTQEQLAEKLGITSAAVSQWETRVTAPSGPSRILLAQTLALPLDVIDSWFSKAEVA